MPAPPPPGSKTSESGDGEITSEFSIGHGLYEIYAASVKHTTGSTAIAARISHIYKTGDGTEVEVILASGTVSQYIPLVLQYRPIIQGPGFLRSTCFHVTTMTHVFNAEYRKFTPTELAQVGIVK